MCPSALLPDVGFSVQGFHTDYLFQWSVESCNAGSESIGSSFSSAAFFPLACMHWNHTVAFWGHNLRRASGQSVCTELLSVHAQEMLFSSMKGKRMLGLCIETKKHLTGPSLSFFSAWQSHGWAADSVHSLAGQSALWCGRSRHRPDTVSDLRQTLFGLGLGPTKQHLKLITKSSSSVATLSFALRSKGEGGQPVTWLFRRWPVISVTPTLPKPPLHAPHAP